jgi:hypothetical protein
MGEILYTLLSHGNLRVLVQTFSDLKLCDVHRDICSSHCYRFSFKIFEIFWVSQIHEQCAISRWISTWQASNKKRLGYSVWSGFRVLVHDRRNTCAADIGFGDGSKTELEMQVLYDSLDLCA